MRKGAKRIIAVIMCLLMFSTVLILPVSAADNVGGTSSSGSQSSISMSDLSKILSLDSYSTYLRKNGSFGKGEGTVVINALDYNTDEKYTTALVEKKNGYYGEDNCLYIPDTGKVTWNFNVDKKGLYIIEVEYCQVVGKTNEIEKIIYINGEVLFSEARSIILSKTWVYDYITDENGETTFRTDNSGNDIRPSLSEKPEWKTYALTDSNGYYSTPFQFLLKEGENSITFESTREPVVIKSITVKPYEGTKTYEEYLSEHGDVSENKAPSGSSIKIEAENPVKVSNVTMYPVYDRTSSITSGLTGNQSAKIVKYNTAGKEQWQNVGEWMEYQIDVPETGYYKIAFRYKQDLLSGMYVSRKVYIDGELPFEEANNCRFEYTSDWRLRYLGDENTEFEFYLTKGTHSIRFEAVLGEMGEYIQKVDSSLANINACYLEILKLTGSNPDKNRTYHFAKVMPDVLNTMMVESVNLEQIFNYLVTQVGKGEKTAIIEQIYILLHKMASDEEEIPGNLDNLKTQLGSLGTWINSAKTQPLQVDYMIIQPDGEDLPKAEANFFQKIWYETKLFFYSFVIDYNSFGSTSQEAEENSIEVWVVTGRDQAQIIRNLIENRFTPYYNISVNVKLVSAGTLLPSVLAGVGPDVSLMEASTTVIDYALRHAVIPLNDFLENDADDILAEFPDAAMIPLTLYNYDVKSDTTSETYYGLPDSLTFPMMFYRKDILASLGLEIPKTWDDLLSLIPILQFNNMEIGIQNDIYTFIYQSGNEAYTDEGMRINFDSSGVLQAFTKMCNMYTQYSLPYVYDFSNRFRTGEMPIGISAYTTCNQLSVFASELSGRWTFVPLPGYEYTDENGETKINNSAIATVTGTVMLKGCDNEEAAWEFMKWYTSKEFQVPYSNEVVSIMGIASRPATANTSAIQELPWTNEEATNILLQFNNLAAVPNHPGSYYLARYVNFAFLNVYNKKADPSDSLLSYVNTINKELTRKRKEFGMYTLEIGQTLEDLKAQIALEENK